jgi:phosphoribosylpyrophosphate synthetase
MMSDLAHCGVDEMIVATPHSPVMAAACKEFGMVFHEIDPSSLFAERVKTFVPDEDIKNVCAYAPDFGSIERAIKFAKVMNCPVLFNLKDRKIYNETSIAETDNERIKTILDKVKDEYEFDDIHYITKELVEGKVFVMTEDEAASCGTANKTGILLRDNGAKYLFLVVTHPVLTSGWREKLLYKNPFGKIMMTDSIRRGYEKSTGGHIVDISIAPLIASKLFKILG